ncbi:MAG: hypothetical protein Q7V58_06055 [Actinomycetota bacterium]|nr:hypothetical protein [Actinomycetota bacterium]
MVRRWLRSTQHSVRSTKVWSSGLVLVAVAGLLAVSASISPAVANSAKYPPVPHPTAYAANVGDGAQGLVCPWGGQYDGFGLCVGTGSIPLVIPSPTPSPSRPSGVAGQGTRPPIQPRPGTVQVPDRPAGGVDTVDDTAG